MLDILDISPLFDTWIANMFPEFIGFYIFDVLLSTAVIILFNGQMVLFLRQSFLKKNMYLNHFVQKYVKRISVVLNKIS